MAKSSPPPYMPDRNGARYEQAQPAQYTRYAQTRLISISRAKSAAMRSHPGAQYVSAKLVDNNTYRVRLKKNGHVFNVYVDARTGRVKN